MAKLRDVAIKTGFTVSTVSKALNRSEEISPKTAQKIMVAAKELGYTPKRASGWTAKTIGVILPEVQSLYHAGLLQRLGEEIEKYDYVMLTMFTSSFTGSVEPYMERMRQYKPDGLIIYCTHFFTENEYRIINNSGIPTIMLNESNSSFAIDSISIQTEMGVRLAVEHLIQLGHRKIGYIGEYNSDVRYQMFCKILEKNGIKVNPHYILQTSKRFEEGGYELAKELLKRKELPTGIVASYDQIALGAMRAFQEQGVKIPEDISIVGFDNIIMDDYSSIPLTSVTSPVEQMGITAVKILMDAIRNPETHVVQNVFLQSRLVIRKSTCLVEKNED